MLTKFIPFIFVALWSSGFIGAQYGLQFAEPATFLLIRMIGNIIIFIILLFIFKAHLPKGKEAIHSLIAGVLIHGFYLGGTYQAIALGMSSGLCALLVGVQPILTAVLLVNFGNQRLQPVQWVGLALGLIGITLVLQGNIEWQDTSNQYTAYLFAFIALIGITFGTLYQKRYCQNVDLVGSMVWQYSAASLVFLPVALLNETMVVTWNAEFIFGLSWLVLVVSVTAISLLLYMIKKGDSSSVASTFYLIPPMTAFQAWIIFDEHFDTQGAVGFALAAVAVYLVIRKPKERPLIEATQ